MGILLIRWLQAFKYFYLDLFFIFVDAQYIFTMKLDQFRSVNISIYVLHLYEYMSEGTDGKRSELTGL